MDEETGSMVGVDGGFDDELGGPCRGGMRGDAEVDQATSAEREHDEDVEDSEPCGEDGEEVASPRFVQMVANERSPPLSPTAAGSRWPVLRDGPRRDAVPELGQLASDQVLAPCRVLTPHAADQTTKIEVDRRAATWSPGAPSPAQPPAGAVPADDGFGLHDDDGVKQTAKTAGEGSQKPAVEALQTWGVLRGDAG
jgi:hypothetical protein